MSVQSSSGSLEGPPSWSRLSTSPPSLQGCSAAAAASQLHGAPPGKPPKEGNQRAAGLRGGPGLWGGAQPPPPEAGPGPLGSGGGRGRCPRRRRGVSAGPGGGERNLGRWASGAPPPPPARQRGGASLLPPAPGRVGDPPCSLRPRAVRLPQPLASPRAAARRFLPEIGSPISQRLSRSAAPEDAAAVAGGSWALLASWRWEERGRRFVPVGKAPWGAAGFAARSDRAPCGRHGMTATFSCPPSRLR